MPTYSTEARMIPVASTSGTASESPPGRSRRRGGDTTHIAQVRRVLADRVTFNGNVHSMETLIRGTRGDDRDGVVAGGESGPQPRSRASPLARGASGD